MLTVDPCLLSLPAVDGQFADVMAPALMMCRRLEVDSAELLAHTPKDAMGWKAWLDLQVN